MHKNIILLEFEYRIGDLVEIRPGFNQFPEVLDYEDPTSFLGLILKANVKYIPFSKNYNWDDNQRCNVLPLYPEAENCNEECEDNKVPPQYNFNIEEFRIF